MKKLTLAVVALMLLATTSFSQTTSINVTVSWTAPTTGSPCVKYELEKSTDIGVTWTQIATPTTNSAVVILPVGTTVIMRVRGVDASTRVGAWSANSDPYIPDAGVPSAPGKPAIVKI